MERRPALTPDRGQSLGGRGDLCGSKIHQDLSIGARLRLIFLLLDGGPQCQLGGRRISRVRPTPASNTTRTGIILPRPPSPMPEPTGPISLPTIARSPPCSAQGLAPNFNNHPLNCRHRFYNHTTKPMGREPLGATAGRRGGGGGGHQGCPLVDLWGRSHPISRQCAVGRWRHQGYIKVGAEPHLFRKREAGFCEHKKNPKISPDCASRLKRCGSAPILI